MNNAFWEELGKTFDRTAKEISKKAEDFYGEQKIKNKINEEKLQAKRAKLEIGELMYERFSQGEEMDTRVIELCQKVQQHENKASQYQEQMEETKSGKICTGCGKKVEKSVSFCPYCGYSFIQETCPPDAAKVVSDAEFVSEKEVMRDREMQKEAEVDEVEEIIS